MKKCYTTCSTCIYDIDNPFSYCSTTRCDLCTNYSTEDLIDVTPGTHYPYTHCRCLSIKYDEECPYYKEAEDGQAKE